MRLQLLYECLIFVITNQVKALFSESYGMQNTQVGHANATDGDVGVIHGLTPLSRHQEIPHGVRDDRVSDGVKNNDGPVDSILVESTSRLTIVSARDWPPIV